MSRFIDSAIISVRWSSCASKCDMSCHGFFRIIKMFISRVTCALTWLRKELCHHHMQWSSLLILQGLPVITWISDELSWTSMFHSYELNLTSVPLWIVTEEWVTYMSINLKLSSIVILSLREYFVFFLFSENCLRLFLYTPYVNTWFFKGVSVSIV